MWFKAMDFRKRRMGRDGEASGVNVEASGIDVEASDMDVKLWGELQRYIDLKEVLAKLPLQEFFQLRLVCKEWNRLASDRKFLEESFRNPIPKPYFVVNACSVGRRKLTCLLTYDGASRRWSSTRLPSFLGLHSGDLVSEGLLHSYHHFRENREQVFNIHTRVFHTLPEALRFSEATNPNRRVPASSFPLPFPFRTLAVDTSVRPHTFQLILSESSKNPPQIYNSQTNSWTLLSSRQADLDDPDDTIREDDCEHSSVVYSRYDTHILSYAPEEDAWFQIETPPGSCDSNRRSMGTWRGRLFDVTAELRQLSITIWELVDHRKQEWKAFESMSKDLFSWVIYADRLILPLEMDLQIRASYCDEYVLVYSSPPEESLVARFVMCNLVTRKWEKIEVGRLVHLHRVHERRRPEQLKLMRTYPMPHLDKRFLMHGY
ncbi:hypothetical protein M758_9G161300 [Ceratodon purpureus]|nr:hypothetical protein M758_9G161300 [Ceratodon purpureus]